MSNRTNYTRQHYFINKKFQFSFILKFCLLVLLGAALSIGLIFFLSRDTLTSSFNDSKLVIESTASAMLPAVLMSNIIVFALVAIAVIVVTLFISHKIAGPLYRLEQGFTAVIEGDLEHRIHFRKKDQVGVLADRFNEMTESIQRRLNEIKKEVAELHQKATGLGAADELLAEIEKLQAAIDKEFS